MRVTGQCDEYRERRGNTVRRLRVVSVASHAVLLATQIPAQPEDSVWPQRVSRSTAAAGDGRH